MATKYVEPNPMAGPPVPYRTEREIDLADILDRMTRLSKKGYAITDLKALELMAHFLYHLENYRTDKNSSIISISLAVALTSLSKMVKLLTNFRPMFRETTSSDIMRCLRLNFAHCYQEFLNYIDEVSSRLIILVEESIIENNRSSFILNLERIKFFIAHVKNKVLNKFELYDAIKAENCWGIVNNYSNSAFLPELVYLIFTEFPRNDTPLPPWMIPSKSSILSKILFSKEAYSKASAENAVCCICHIGGASTDMMSVMPDCNHVYCSRCYAIWLEYTGNTQWSCLACGRRVTEYAGIACDGEYNVVKFLVPPHQQIVDIELRRNAPH